MNKEKLLIILGSILALGACSEKEDLSPKTEVNMDQVQTDKSALETEIEDLLEEDVELVMTSISLDEYMKDSEENINYSTGDQKYLSPAARRF